MWYCNSLIGFVFASTAFRLREKTFLHGGDPGPEHPDWPAIHVDWLQRCGHGSDRGGGRGWTTIVWQGQVSDGGEGGRCRGRGLRVSQRNWPRRSPEHCQVRQYNIQYTSHFYSWWIFNTMWKLFRPVLALETFLCWVGSKNSVQKHNKAMRNWVNTVRFQHVCILSKIPTRLSFLKSRAVFFNICF